MEDFFRSFWSFETRDQRDAKEVENQAKRGLQDMFISTRNCGINLKLRGRMRDKKNIKSACFGDTNVVTYN